MQNKKNSTKLETTLWILLLTMKQTKFKIKHRTSKHWKII